MDSGISDTVSSGDQNSIRSFDQKRILAGNSERYPPDSQALS